MGVRELLIYIENHGISLIFMSGIGIAAWKYAIPFFKELTRMLVELRKFFEDFNRDIVSGKGLQLLLILKCQEIRWSIEKKYIEYILKNSIKKNWDSIISELNGYTTQKLINFDEDLHDIIDKIVFKTIRTMFKAAIERSKMHLYDVLMELKNDETNHENAQRAVKIHMQNFQNELILEIKSLFD
ncbi:hypothetical protein EII29_08380 [Leptotrichia sp. OH3620_COT-345]|uniref:hypothetical protein n=1 Tax=Leptotrichia sp. OH3620_COT-345 TaxID=2491048 RepID=UPI000F653E3D|nr:hypothetical protein [Leptotrichia sp. OH3620_COT-345]RRD39122.1 hypothetical protein EII29_08380 [Leptotrichia sp. OH3620_COT-345]